MTSGRRDGVLSIGRIYCDLVFTGLDGMPALGREVFGTSMTIAAGGGAFIAAAHLAALGRETALVARLGTDALALGLEDELDASGCTLDFVERSADAGPQLTVVLAEGSERAFISRRAGTARPKTLEAALSWSRACHLHIAEYATLHEIPDLIRLAKANGLTVSVDPSWDSQLIGDAGLLEACAGVDVFLPNLEEALAITGREDADTALDALCQAVPLVVIKAGPEGAMVGTREGFRARHSAPQVTVRDTTGAGDAFNAGFIDAWLTGNALPPCLAAGIACGSESVQYIGGFAARPTEDIHRLA